MKVLSIVGARPQFIKEAVIHEELRKKGIKEVLVHSGQHYDTKMSDIFFKTLRIKKPDYCLGIKSFFHGEMTARIMIDFERIAIEEKPDIVFVYGDTNTTLAGALVAAKLTIPLAHIEAGIRMKPKTMPEEINRIIVDRISNYLFCPTLKAVSNLKKEGIVEGAYFTGDVMYDLFLKMKPLFSRQMYKKFSLKKDEYVIVTLHRNYNVDYPIKLETILRQLAIVSREKQVLFSLHPRTKKRIEEFKLHTYLKRFIVTDPLDYVELMGLTLTCFKVITDSGGYQKEAYFAGKQAVVVMPDSGWRELNTWNILTKPQTISQNTFKASVTQTNPHIFGRGTAGKKIVQHIYKM